MRLHLPLRSVPPSATAACHAVLPTAYGPSIQAGCNTERLYHFAPLQGAQGTLASSSHLPGSLSPQTTFTVCRHSTLHDRAATRKDLDSFSDFRKAKLPLPFLSKNLNHFPSSEE